MFNRLAIFVILFTLTFTNHVHSQNISFETINTNFQGALFGNVEFADIDNDGDQDVLVCGREDGWQSLDSTSLHLNDGLGNFTKIEHNLPHVQNATTAFADVDNDGDQDVLITGTGDYPVIHADLFINDGSGNFTLQNGTPFIPNINGEIAFADIDNDGDQDVFICGTNADEQSFSKLYMNDSGEFTESTSAFDFDHAGPVEFADIDGDSDMDLLRVITSPDGEMTLIHKNDGAGNFTLSPTGLPGFTESAIATGDIDMDGDIDVLISGASSNGAKSDLYLNLGNGEFTVFAGSDIFPDFSIGKNSLADFDNDGDLDIFMTGTLDGGGVGIITNIFENTGDYNFVLSDAHFGAYLARIDVADINGDGRLDVILGGTTVGDPTFATWIFLNQSVVNTFDEKQELELICYPNPTADFITFETSKSIKSIAIYNSIGQLTHIEKPSLASFTLDLSEYPNGTYITRIVNVDGASKSIIISKK